MGILADLAVQFSQTGAQALKDIMADIKKTGGELAFSLKDIGRVATTAFGAASAAVAGYTAVGLQNTVTANQMALAHEQLGRQIAAIFLPTIEAVTNRVREATEWFRSLTGAQQENLRVWTETAVVIGSVAIAISTLLPGAGAVVVAIGAIAAGLTTLFSGGLSNLFEAVMPLFDALRDAFMGIMDALSPLIDAIGGVFLQVVNAVASTLGRIISTIMPGITAVIKAVATVFGDLVSIVGDLLGVLGKIASIGFEAFIGVLKFVSNIIEGIASFIQKIHDGLVALGVISERTTKKNTERRDVAIAGGAFEGITATFNRIQAAVMKLGTTGKSPEEESAAHLAEIRKDTKRTADKISGIEPGLA